MKALILTIPIYKITKYYKTSKIIFKTISTQINLPCSEQKQWKDHTPTRNEPLPRDHSLQQGGWEGHHADTRKKRYKNHRRRDNK